jgi:two-component system sensor histidine kinase KdpD
VDAAGESSTVTSHSHRAPAPPHGGQLERSASRWAQLPWWLGAAARYGASVAGVAALTWLISLVFSHYHVANISMIYLLLVLALAVFAGRGPAIVASVLSFLAFDWFFVPPVGRFTVSSPEEWLALFLFLVVALITGQLAAGLRRRAEEAHRREREVSTLYELSIAILRDAHLEHVLQIIAERLLHTLALRQVSILLLGEGGRLQPVAEAGEPLAAVERLDRDDGARWTLEAGISMGRYSVRGGRVTQPLEHVAHARHDEEGTPLGVFLPIALGGETLGVLAAFGGREGDPIAGESQRLLQAFVAQTALAIGRARLAQEEERARALVASERLKSTFLASVSHDLRTPLTAIRAAAAALRQAAHARNDTAHEELAAGIDREAERLNRLVGNLLEMSRIEAGGLPPKKAPEDLSEIVGGAVGRIEPLAGDRTLRVTIAEDLPLVPVDAAQIDRVLTNLLENAVKFSPGGSEIRLDVSAGTDDAIVRLHNAGPPIPEAEQERIFDKFYRLNSPAGTQGTGLGLAICKGIVEAHGGRIWVENEPGGVVFSFTLPLGPLAPPRPRQPEPVGATTP